MAENKIGMESLYIPKEVMTLLQSGEITPQESLVLSIIDFLDSKGECFASNDFIAKSIGLSIERTRKIITNLEKKKYIDRTVVYKPGTNEVDKRILKIKFKTTKIDIPMVKNDQGVRSKITRGTVKNDHIEKSIEKSKSKNIYLSASTVKPFEQPTRRKYTQACDIG